MRRTGRDPARVAKLYERMVLIRAFEEAAARLYEQGELPGFLHSSVGQEAGINVNGVAPGPVYTRMTEGQPYHDDMSPLGRLGQPADIAEAVLFLASPAANWITGHVLDVNGGMLMG